jgi:NitT/TauT family transport system substrate-binding protein
VIGGMSREKAGYPLIGYFASNNAYAAGLKTPKDLAGKRVAVTQTGSSFHYSLGLLADKYGFKLSGVKVVPLQSLSNAAAALKGETVDAALLPASTARKLIDDGGAKLLGWVGDETPWQLGAVFASPRTLANKPLVTKVLAVLARADREYHDVILTTVTDGKARSTRRQNRCWRSSPNTPTCRSSRWSAIAPMSIPTASSTSGMSATRSNGCRSRALSTRDSMRAISLPGIM